MSFLFFNPNLIVNKRDMLTTGIVYLPIGLCYVSNVLKKNNINHKVIDLFGNNPNNIQKLENNFMFLGDAVEKFDIDIKNTNAIFIYANQVINHLSIIDLKNKIRAIKSDIKIFFFENTQAVTAYSLKDLKNEFIKSENDYIIIGDPEFKIKEICKNILSDQNINKNYLISQNTSSINDREINYDIEELGYPNWDCIPIKNYWKIGHAHGPQSSKKYLSILSSRGCPYPCNFCIIPETSNRRWRDRSPLDVVNEIIFFQKKYDVNEFHFEDLNPTVNEKRIIQMCEMIIKQKIKIKWKIVAGTKVESLKQESTIELMSKAGCNYISISPESGSEKLMKKINKPFNLDHAIKNIYFFNKYKIFSQACFVLGYPGESKSDLDLTKEMIIKLTKVGIDEIALFIITPIPGSKIFKEINGYKSLSDLNFSPVWRKDYLDLFKTRIKFYIYFVSLKFMYFPLKIMKQCYNFFTLKFETKMEMVPYKFIKNKINLYKFLFNEKKNNNF